MGRQQFNGGCHCGSVRFGFEAELPLQVVDCNCSICRMTGYRHVFVPHAEFELEEPADSLAEYRFNTGTARHWFCSNCGIKSFYQPRSHPDHYSVNFRCLDGAPAIEAEFSEFDGENWERNIDALHAD